MKKVCNYLIILALASLFLQGAYAQKTRRDFSSDADYSNWLKNNISVGQRVKAISDYNSIKVGMTGTYIGLSKYKSTSIEACVLWDTNLGATPMDDALPDNAPKDKKPYIYFCNWSLLEIVGSSNNNSSSGNIDDIVRRLNELSRQYNKYNEVYTVDNAGNVRSNDKDGDIRLFSLNDIQEIFKITSGSEYMVRFVCKGSNNCSIWKGNPWDRNYFAYNASTNSYGADLLAEQWNKLKSAISGGGGSSDTQKERPAARKY